MKLLGYDPYEAGLDVVHTMSDYVLCKCTYHDDSKPSMAFYIETGSFYCFACGEYGNIDKLIKTTGGYKTYKLIEVKTKFDANEKEYWNHLTRLNVNNSDEYLLNRGITSEQIEQFNIMSDDEKIVIPFYTNNEITGIKMRWKKPDGRAKYMNFGLQPLLFGDTDFDNYDKIIVVEGILGYFHFNKQKIGCVSVLSSNRVLGYEDIFSNFQKTQFRIMFDPDNAGYYGTSKLLFLNRMNNNVFALQTFYDVDNMSCEQFKEVLETNKITKNVFTYIDKFDTMSSRELYKKSLLKFINKQLK